MNSLDKFEQFLPLQHRLRLLADRLRRQGDTEGAVRLRNRITRLQIRLCDRRFADLGPHLRMG
jgi:hypothetical protein